MNAHKTAFADFYAAPTPARAVELAIADYLAGRGADLSSPFVPNLRRAAELCARHDEAVASLWEVRAMLGRLGANADTSHPARPAWEACGEAIRRAGGAV